MGIITNNEDSVLTVTISEPLVSLSVDASAEIHILTTLERGPQGIPGTAAGTFLQYPAGLALSGHRMVVLDDQEKVIYADNSILSHANKVLGMTTGASVLNDISTIQVNGSISEPSWNWELEVPVWLSTNGLLTQVFPTYGFSLIIGFPLTSTNLFIDIKEPIFLL